MENINSLVTKNKSFDYTYGITNFDLEKVNNIIRVIEETRSKDPEPGDRIICVGPKVEYTNGHLEKPITEKYSTICVQPYFPFTSVHEKNKEEKVYFDTSGGYWLSCDDRTMYEYVGKSLKTFKTWGNRGPCAAGTVHFHAEVNVWKLFKEDIY